MADFSHINIARQSGLLKEMSLIANNMANISTTGYRREGAVFTEFVAAHGSKDGGANNLSNTTSIGHLGAHYSDFTTGEIKRTGGTFDLAITGEGFFMVESPDGERLTRAGNFMTDKEGTLITPSGYAVLDEANSRIQIPQGIGEIIIARDGTMSADGLPLGKIGVVTAPPESLSRIGDNLWETDQALPADVVNMMQGFLEGSNVNGIMEIARLIEVQRSYESGQKLLDIEDETTKKTISAMRQGV